MISTGKNIRRAVVAAAGIAAAASLLTGCDKTSVSCHDTSCDVSVSGNTGVDLGLDKVPGHPGKHYAGVHSFDVIGYEAHAVRVNTQGQDYTVNVGETKRVAGVMTIRVISVKGESAKLHVDAV